MKYFFLRYFRIWRRLVLNSFRTQMSTSLGSTGYLIGKLLRFGLFLGYMVAIFNHFPSLKGYSLAEAILFFMTFNLIDVGSQFLFRGMYGIKYLIEEGDFDKILTQPAHPLFRISTMNTDLLDLLTLIPIVGVTIWTVLRLPGDVSIHNVLIYVLLLGNGLIIAYAAHVALGAFSVRTQEMESAIWIYRDVMTLGRFPISIYSEVLRGILVTAVPIGIMISFPSEALLGILSGWGVIYALVLGGGLHILAQWYWRSTLREYTSISS